MESVAGTAGFPCAHARSFLSSHDSSIDMLPAQLINHTHHQYHLRYFRCSILLSAEGKTTRAQVLSWSDSKMLSSGQILHRMIHNRTPWLRKRCFGNNTNESMDKRRRKRSQLSVRSLDAAMPFDFEHRQKKMMEEKERMKIGIVGFGNFGQFLARRMLQQNHSVLALSRTDYSAEAKKMGVRYFRDADDFCEEHPDVVLLSTSILSTDIVLRSLPLQRLKRSTLFVDVLSVKEFPKNLFLQILPPEFNILCTHPMFGPESGKSSWQGLPFVFEKVRVHGDKGAESCNRFLDIFAKEGCRMVEMDCDEHDKYAAGSQFVTHTVGRVLGKLQLQSTPINTKGYETLLNLVENTAGDSFDLYYGLFMYNMSATDELQRLEQAFDEVKQQLFDQLHDILRKQLFPAVPSSPVAPKHLQLPRLLSPDQSLNDNEVEPNGAGVFVDTTISINQDA